MAAWYDHTKRKIKSAYDIANNNDSGWDEIGQKQRTMWKRTDFMTRHGLDKAIAIALLLCVAGWCIFGTLAILQSISGCGHDIKQSMTRKAKNWKIIHFFMIKQKK